MSDSPSAEPHRYADRVPPLAPYAAAAWAHHEGRPSTLRLRSSLGEDEDFPVEIFFRSEGFFPFERFALELCRGRVLDVGSGVGAHALELQGRGFDVLGLEVCAPLVRLQRERGVREVAWGDFRFWKGPTFDTVIMLMNGLGPTGTLEGLDRFLRHAGAWLAPGGQLLVDAGPARPDPSALAVGWPPAGDDPGQAWIELSHGGLVGRPFRELYVDLETLASRATAAGWRFDIAFEDEAENGLARLVLA